MARARRTQFAAPLVMVVASACGSSKAPDPKPEPRPTPKDDRPRWTLSRQGDRCTAMPHVESPPADVATCNPPPPMAIACGDLAEGSIEVVQMKPGRCVVAGGNRLVGEILDPLRAGRTGPKSERQAARIAACRNQLPPDVFICRVRPD